MSAAWNRRPSPAAPAAAEAPELPSWINPINPMAPAVHPDGRHAAAELVTAAGSLQGKISDEPGCAKWPDQRNRGLLQAAKQAEAALKKYMLSNEPRNWNLLYEARSYLRPAIKREEDFRFVLCAAGVPADAQPAEGETR